MGRHEESGARPSATGRQPARGSAFIVWLSGFVSNVLLRIWRSSTQKVLSLTAFGMLFGLARDMLFAARLGTGETTDALVVALTLPLLVDTVGREGTKFSLVPLFIERRNVLSTAEYHAFISGVLNLSLAFGVVVVILIEVAAPWLVVLIAPGLQGSGQLEATMLLRLCGPLIIFALGITVLSVHLNSEECFTPVALRNAMTPGAVCLVTVLAWSQDRIALWIAGAHVLGFAAFFLLLFSDVLRSGYRYSWTAWVSQKDVRDIRASASLPTLGFIIRQLSFVAERFFSSLTGTGGVGAYYFGRNMVSAFQTLIGTTIATTGLPRMARMEFAGDKGRIAVGLRRAAIRVNLLTVPVTMFVILFHLEIIQYLYGHGSFGRASVEKASEVLLWWAPGLLFVCLVPILQSGLYAKKAYDLVFRNMCLMVGARIALSWLFSGIWGLNGIAMAGSVSAAIAMLNIVFLLRKTGVSLVGRAPRESSP